MSSSSQVLARSIPLVGSVAIALLTGCSDLPVQPASYHLADATGPSLQSVTLAGVDVRGEYILNGSSTMYLRSQDAANGWILGHGAFTSEPYTYAVTGTVTGTTATFRMERSDSYVMDFSGTIDADGLITGTWRDLNSVTGAFIAVPQDTDTDGVLRDNCPELPNLDQSNSDGDLDGDACDLDVNNDGAPERHWDLRADYGLELQLGGELLQHTLSVHSHEVQGGAVLGTGSYLASPFNTWTVAGIVTETSLSLRIVYNGDSYSIDLSGVILNDGSLSGTWRDSNGLSGIFRTTSGNASLSSPDSDGDGVVDGVDNAPHIPNPGQEDSDGDGLGDVADSCPNDPENDVDGDGVCGDVHNAPNVYNPDQADSDSDHIADVLDACPRDSHNDEDRDHVCGDVDNAPTVFNPGQEDGDRDGIGDVGDNCPSVFNPDQRDGDRDGIGDACEANTPPVLAAIGNQTVDELVQLTFRASASDSDIPANSLTYSLDAGTPVGASINSTTGEFTWTPTEAQGSGDYTFKVRVTDNGSPNLSDEEEITVRVNEVNVAPVLASIGNKSVDEGSLLTFNASATDADVPANTLTFSLDAGAPVGASIDPSTGLFTWTPTNGPARSQSITIRVTDNGLPAMNDYETINVTVNNVVPVIGTINVVATPIAVGTNNVTVTWNFTDPGTETWTCSIEWDSGSGFTAASYVGPKSCNATATLPEGVYTARVKVADDVSYDSDELSTYIVVYDPNGGFVTGGGWINSPAGAYVADPSLTGKANFGFVSKYQQGQTVPQGNTEFQFHAGNLNFKSTVYEWLVVAGDRAQFKGDGTINGVAGYGFLLTGIDGSPDKFRIKIVNKSTGAFVYDNQAGELDDSPAATALGGGSIVIHTKK